MRVLTRRNLLASIAALVTAPVLTLTKLTPQFVVRADLETLPYNPEKPWLQVRPTGKPSHYFLDDREVPEAAFFAAAARSELPQMQGWARAWRERSATR